MNRRALTRSPASTWPFRHRSRPCVAFTCVSMLLVGAVAAARGAEQAATKPSDVGLVEEVGIPLVLLDVEVVNKEGQPQPGLDPEDFTVKVDYREHPIYSVDDLCSCSPDTTGTGRRSRAEPKPEGIREPVKTLMFFDFSQLRQAGRAEAIEIAKRWVADRKRTGGQVRIVAYSTRTGLRSLCPFTAGRDRLTKVLDEAAADGMLVDPFPDLLESRQEQCGENPTICPMLAREEHSHGKRSLRALRRVLSELTLLPGRKRVLFFNGNGVVYPGRYYCASEFVAGDHISLLDQLGATSVSARAAIYAIGSGTDLDANLADYSGGDHSHGAVDVEKLLDEMARGECCVYRIGLQLSAEERDRVHHVRVLVQGRPVAHTYRVKVETKLDQWLVKATSVLANPSQARDLPVQAAVIPVRAVGSRWDVAVEVSVDMGSLEAGDGARVRRGAWEVGALLHDARRGKAWEMLGVSRLRRGGGSRSHAPVMHIGRIDGLRPGEYRLAAFVRDRTGGGIGGAEAAVTLPPPDEETLVGPVVMRAEHEHVPAPLPMLRKKAVPESVARAFVRGPVPLADALVRQGEALEIVSWVCGNPGETVLSFVSGAGRPLFRLSPAEVKSAGRCSRVSDRVDTSGLAAGAYTYHLRVRDKEGMGPSGETVFVVGGGQAAEERAAAGAEP